MKGMRSAGSAHRGLGEWLLQRFTAVYMAGFVSYVTIHLLVSPAADYSSWKGWITDTAMRVSTMLFFGSAAIHAWIGMRSVYMDYLHALWLRLTAIVVTAGGLVAMMVWVFGILWGIPA